MTLTAAGHLFDSIDFDAQGDTLFLRVPLPQGHRTHQTCEAEEGQAVMLDEQRQLVAVELLNVRWLLEQGTELTLTVPDVIELRFTAAELEPALTVSA